MAKKMNTNKLLALHKRAKADVAVTQRQKLVIDFTRFTRRFGLICAMQCVEQEIAELQTKLFNLQELYY